MCGIAGFLDRKAHDDSTLLTARVMAMCDAIRHRGPDDAGAWVDAPVGLALGHRRLSILDLSPKGHQPMTGAAGRFVIVFNGELYNFLEIRADLESRGYRFQGHSDTEVVLAAIDVWGVSDAVRRFNGMFAFALWDGEERLLYLCRDRMGKKPLYYGWCGQTLLFGSELKALRAHPAFQAGLNLSAIAIYLRLGYIPAPHSIYQGIRKLPAATVLTIRTSDAGNNDEPAAYWSAADAAAAGLSQPIADANTCLEQIYPVLRSAVGLRMISDVPVGAFLSGGIDSSLVVALMQALSGNRVKTFCVGFREQSHDEAGHARTVAAHLGTDHTEVTLTADDALAIIPRLPRIFDEPFADSSQIPVLAVSELARQRVTVSLSGDGGDELFAGYTTYGHAARFYAKYGWVPRPVRSLAGRILSVIPDAVWNTLSRGTGAIPAAARARRLASALRERKDSAVYMNLVSIWQDPAGLVPGAVEPESAFTADAARAITDTIGKMQLLDVLVYLPDDILVNLDRTSMAVALEARSPFLDYRLYELAWRVPTDFKIKGGVNKWILRQLLYRYVPRQLVDRPKFGLSTPMADWLRGSLRTWAGDLLSPARFRRDGLIDPEKVWAVWESHQRGFDCGAQLWTVLMLQSWLDEAMAHPVRRPALFRAS